MSATSVLPISSLHFSIPDVIITFLSKLNRRCRSSRQEVFCKKGVSRNFAKFTGKHLCQCLFLNKVAGLSAATKKEALAQVLSCEFSKIYTNTYSYRTPPVAVSADENSKLFSGASIST